MNRALVMLLAACALIIIVALVVLGVFAPGPVPHPVEKVLPNERFQSR
ncbi:MAG: hypothetical protein JOY71_27270 [Acetobacteraceae bacterium]|nr:hypothetical protein [Acetobacteraceae bacterium]MBV8525769.1 hypothetical protein [Acetobacteraceae bacterium]